MTEELYTRHAGYEVPDGYVVYLKELKGWTIRVAINPDKTNITPEQMGFNRADDQDSVVYTVLRSISDDSTAAEQEAKNASIDALIEGKTGQPGAPQREAREKGNLMRSFAHNHERLIKEGRVPDVVAHHRLASCTGITKDGTKVSEPCTRYKNEKGGWGTGHCIGCGCPEWPIAQMRVEGLLVKLSCGTVPGKAWFPMACPIGRFSEHLGRRALKKAARDATIEDNHGTIC